MAISGALLIGCCQPHEQKRPKPVSAPVTTSSEVPHSARSADPLVDVAVGYSHTCAIGQSGALWCWGLNDDGQLGTGDTNTRPRPTRVVGIDDAVEVACGSFFTCVRREPGTVSCFGAGLEGQIGDGAEVDRTLPVAVRSINDATQVVADGARACVVRADESVWCWGRANPGFRELLEDAGSPGNPDRHGHTPTPARVRGLPPIEHLTAEGFSLLATTRDGRAFRLDPSDGGPVELEGVERPRGMLLRGRDYCVLTDRLECARRSLSARDMVTVRITPEAPLTHLAGTLDYGCFVDAEDRVGCWGESQTEEPTIHAEIRDVRTLVASGGFGCALDAAGELSCWGRNDEGQLGTGSAERFVLTPTRVEALTRAVAVSSGRQTNCAHVGEQWRCWGYGGIGPGEPARIRIPRASAGMDPYIDGEFMLCGVDSGVGSCRRREPVPQNTARDEWTVRRARRLAVSDLHACFLRDRGVTCVGQNQRAALGVLARARTESGIIEGTLGAIAVATGLDSGCALSADGGVICWGAGSAQSPFDEDVDRNLWAPHPVGGLPTTDPGVAIEGRYRTMCVLTRAGHVWCWGTNRNGELGAPPEAGTRGPHRVEGLQDAEQVAVGSSFACARLAGGQVSCWGHGARGELGDGTLVSRHTPRVIADLDRVVSIAAGNYHACAARDDGTVWCWGDNQRNVVGRATPAEHRDALTVTGPWTGTVERPESSPLEKP